MAFYGVSPVAFESVSAVTATNSVDVGTVRQEGDEKYIYVYNAGNSQISVGHGATVSAVSGYSVTVSSSAGDLCIGVVKHATLTTGTYGWLVTRGFVDSLAAPANSGVVAGAVVQLAADGKIVASAGAGGHVVGKAMAATASAGAFTGFISIH